HRRFLSLVSMPHALRRGPHPKVRKSCAPGSAWLTAVSRLMSAAAFTASSLWFSLLDCALRCSAHLQRLDRDGQPSMVPRQLARGIAPPNILLPRPERPHLHDRHRGGKSRALIIPPIEPDLVAGAKRRAHWTAGVWWRWLRKQGEQRRFVLA